MRNVLLAWLLICAYSVTAQVTEWSQKPSVGFYYTPLRMERYSFSSGLPPDEKLWEHTVNLMATAPLSARLRMGIQYMLVSIAVENKPVDRAHMAGLMAQYNLRAKKRLGIYLEGGYALGNLCPCGQAEPYASDTLRHFRSLGLGLDYRLFPNMHIKGGFVDYAPWKRGQEQYNWTQPFLGVNVYFAGGYKTPFPSKFRERSEPIPKDQRTFYWADDAKRQWSVGLSSAGVAMTQHQRFPDQPDTEPLLRYRQWILTPRLNYWFNQAVMIGIQGSLFRYANNQSDNVSLAHGLGAGVQARFYPLNVRRPESFRAVRIGKRATWNLSPIMGADVRASNYIWSAPEEAGGAWRYLEFQPWAGYALSHRRWFNLFAHLGPSWVAPHSESRISWSGVVGLEYHFLRKSL